MFLLPPKSSTLPAETKIEPSLIRFAGGVNIAVNKVGSESSFLNSVMEPRGCTPSLAMMSSFVKLLAAVASLNLKLRRADWPTKRRLIELPCESFALIVRTGMVLSRIS